MTKAEINKKVFERYPKTDKELSCWQERMRLTALREALRKRLEEEARDKEQRTKQV